jgi:hypothetical protein
LFDVDVVAPIIRCKELGYNESSIVIDVIMSNHNEIKPVNMDNYTTLGMLTRVYEVYSYFNSKQGLMRAQRLYPHIDFRNVVGPKFSASYYLVPIVSFHLSNDFYVSHTTQLILIPSGTKGKLMPRKLLTQAKR